MDNFYFEGKETYKMLLSYLDPAVYETEENVVPNFAKASEFPNHILFDGHPLLFVDFIPSLPEGIFVKTYINNEFITDIKVGVDGEISKEVELGYGISEIVIKNFESTVTYKRYNFKSLNFPLYSELMGALLETQRQTLQQLKGDIYADEVRDESIEKIFGGLFDFGKPIEFDYDKYFNVLLGDTTFPGFNNSLPYVGSEKALKDVAKSFSGEDPEIKKLGLGRGGFKIFDTAKWNELGEDQNPGRIHYFLKELTWE